MTPAQMFRLACSPRDTGDVGDDMATEKQELEAAARARAAAPSRLLWLGVGVVGAMVVMKHGDAGKAAAFKFLRSKRRRGRRR
jgi:hypothetical protein